MIKWNPMGMFHTLPGGKIIMADQSFADIIGYSNNGELLGKNLHSLLLYPQQQGHKKFLDLFDIDEKKSGMNAEVFLKGKDGSPVLVLLTIHQVKEENGKEKYYEGFITDITKYQQVEKVKNEQYSTLLSIINSTDAFIFSVDRQYCYTSFNKGHAEVMKRIYGVEIEIGHNLLDYMTVAKDREVATLNLNRALAGEQLIEEAYSGEELRSRLYFQVSHSPIKTEDGGVIGVAVLAQEITERRRAGEALSESERKYRQIFDNVLDGLYLLEVTKDGCFRTIDVNPALESITGIPRSLSVGKTQEEIVPADVADIVNTKYRKCIDAGHPIEEEVELELPSGKRFFHSILIPTRDESGRVNRIIGISRDITEPKRGENVMQARLRLLEFANSHSMDELLTETLDEIEALTGSKIGFYHFLESDQKTLLLQNWSSNTLKNMCKAEGKGSHYDISMAGVWVDCVKERRAVIHNDYNSLPHRKGIPEGHAPVVREVVVPIFRGNLIRAIIGVGNKANDYNENDIGIISQLGDLSWDIAERKRAEEKARELQEYLRMQIDRMPIGLIIWEKDFRVKAWNPAAESIFGFTEEEALNKHPYDLIVPKETQQTIDEIWDRLLEGDLTAHSINENITKDGRIIVCNWTNTPLKGEDGTTTSVLSMVQDITDLKQAENELRESQERLNSVFENAEDGILIADIEHKHFIICNPMMCHMLGYTREDIFSLGVLEIHPEKDLPYVIDQFERQARKEFTLAKNIPMKRKDGSIFYADINSFPITLEGKECLVGFFRDISDRKRSEDALHRLNREMKAISNCNQTLLRAENEQTLLDEICRIICDEAGYLMAWVGYSENDKDKTVRPVAWAGFDSGYIETTRLSWSEDTERGQGPAGTAIRKGEIVYIQDFSTDPRFVPWRESALQRGYRSGIALPLKDENKRVFGVVLIYSSEFNAINPDEIRLLEEMSGDLAYGITVLHTRAERRRVEEALYLKVVELEEEVAKRHIAQDKLEKLNDQLDQKVRERTIELMDKNVELKKEMDIRTNQQLFLEALLESTEAGIVACDADGILTLFNRKSRELHGLRETSIPADQWVEHYDLFLPDGKTMMRKEDVPLFRAFQGERIENDEMMIIPKGGEAKILLASGQLIRNKEGNRIGAVVAMHDITERKKVEETLRASEEKYRGVVENIGIGVTIISPNMEILAQNPRMQMWFPHVDVTRRPICYESFINPSRTDFCINCPTRQTLLDGLVHDAIIETPSGKRILFFRVLSSPIRNKDGKIIAATELVEDITQQKVIEEELRQYRERLEELIKERTSELEKTNMLLLSELTERKRAENELRKLSLAVEQSPVSIVITDKKGNIEYINSKFTQVTGYTRAEASGQNPRILKSGDMSPNNYKQLWQTITSGKEWYGEFHNKKKNGELYWELASISPIFDSKGAITHFLGVKEDISIRKQNETELVQAKEKAEESDRLKTAFLHNISHEIRTPMNAIIGFSSLLGESGQTDETRKSFIEIIMNSSDHLLAIVNDIIEISNIEAGILKFTRNEINLNSLLMDLYKQFSPLAKEKGIEFTFDTALSEVEANVQSDNTKLVQVFSNLINNALKFTEKGRIDFGYSLKDNYLQFYVSDTGIGIPENQFARVFDRFYQVDHAVSRLHEGTGLGLSISKAYVEFLGGKIWLKSQLGKGTVFYFTVPYIIEGPSDRNVRKDLKNEKIKFSKKMTILIAEDEENNFQLMAEFLSKLNLNILHARDGKEAVEICKSSQHIDLVLMDIKMPEMDGYMATKIIKENLPDLPVVVQTAFVVDREKVFKSGCSDFISKPFKKDELLSLIKKHLQSKSK